MSTTQQRTFDSSTQEKKFSFPEDGSNANTLSQKLNRKLRGDSSTGATSQETIRSSDLGSTGDKTTLGFGGDTGNPFSENVQSSGTSGLQSGSSGLQSGSSGSQSGLQSESTTTSRDTQKTMGSSSEHGSMQSTARDQKPTKDLTSQSESHTNVPRTDDSGKTHGSHSQSEPNIKELVKTLETKQFFYQTDIDTAPQRKYHSDQEVLKSPLMLVKDPNIVVVDKEDDEDRDMKHKVDLKKIERVTRTPSPKSPKKATTWSAMKRLLEGKHVTNPKPRSLGAPKPSPPKSPRRALRSTPIRSRPTGDVEGIIDQPRFE